MTKIIYGIRNGEEKFWAEFYCAVCNQIPTDDIWNGNEIVGVRIADLIQVQTFRQKEGEKAMEEVLMMVCKHCLWKIDQKMKEGIRKLIGGEGTGGSLGGVQK